MTKNNASIVVKEQKKETIKINFKNVDLPIINAFRRRLINGLPIMAIEDVFIIRNDSGLFDEIIAHRLGLIPLTTDTTYNLRKNCSCKGEGCSKCQVTLTFKGEGPRTVLSKDLKTTDPNVKPVINNIPIVELLEGQGLEFEAKAELGFGKEHAKWSSGLAYHFYEEEDTITLVYESWGQLPIKEAFKTAGEEIIEDLKKLKL